MLLGLTRTETDAKVNLEKNSHNNLPFLLVELI